MAVLPNSKNQASGARFRQRKISIKVSLPIYKQRDLTSTEGELEPSQVHHLNASATQPRDLHTIETGVDKNEEDEVHLQQVINAAQKALLSTQKQEKQQDSSMYIPTPDASQIWKEASHYYNDHTFKQPDTYIKFSASVEDTVGVEYNMDEEDDEFFQNTLVKQYPKSTKKDANEPKCTEIEFEMVCDKLEKAIEEKQPFLAMDPSKILSYNELSSYILEEFNSSKSTNQSYVEIGSNLKYLSTTTLKEKLSKELNFEPYVTLFDKNPYESPSKQPRSIPRLFELFGQPIYDHWKARKIERKGKKIHPSLKFEDPNASEKDNDNDPYICFRRREFRQARKTRRSDTLGAERIRLLQKSLHRARNLVKSVCQRELLKLEAYEAEEEVFKLRCETKTAKRAVSAKGDEHLFYPHKRKKIIKIIEEEEEDEDEEREPVRKTYKKRGDDVARDKYNQLQAQQQEASSSTQPYVKLPPSKIPDMDLITVSLVLKEKNETIKRAVLEKLRKRKEQDKGFINVTDDPYQPFFNISTNTKTVKELSHIPYSSIGASKYLQIYTTNYLGDKVKKVLEEGKNPLPGVKSFRGSTGELVPSKAFPHLLTLLESHVNKLNTDGYIAQLLSNIETSNFSSYSHGYGYQQKMQQKSQQSQFSPDENTSISEPIFRMRKRVGRGNRVFIDRRGLVERPTDVIDEFLKFDDDKTDSVPNVYDSKADTIKRLDSNWRFDDDMSEYQRGQKDPFGLDPSRLNCISDDTQSIRFGSMLLSKSYDLLRDSMHQRQVLIQQARMRALQQQQARNGQYQARVNSNNTPKSRTPVVNSGDTSVNGMRNQPVKKAGVPPTLSIQERKQAITTANTK